ncbi:MAG TPA: LON peptidase substrate-binding domain-containing protein, partial [Nitrospiraceae bacterium]
MSEQSFVSNLPVLPIKRTVLFPGVMMPLTVGRDRSIAAVEAAMRTEDKTLLVIAQRVPDVDGPELKDLYSIGTKAVIKQIARVSEGQIHAMVQGLERVVLLRLDQTDPYLVARVREYPEPTDTGTEVDALHRAIQ